MEPHLENVCAGVKKLLSPSNPIHEYVKRKPAKDLLKLGQTAIIPINHFQTVTFEQKDGAWVTDRFAGWYNIMIFSDEFEPKDERESDGRLESRKKADQSGVIAGGQESAFAPGKIVCDIGSGEAKALLKYHQDYPNTIFVGIDNGYTPQMEIDSHTPGIYLTNDDWTSLDTIPDVYFDTIISCQAAFMWGMAAQPYSEAHADSEKEGAMMKAITRVAKPNAILRFDWSSKDIQSREYIRQQLENLGWKVYFAPENVVAVKQP